MTSRQLITAETAAQPAVQASRAVQEDGSVIEQVAVPPADASGVAAKLAQFATSIGAKQVTYAVTDVWFPDLVRDLRKVYGNEHVTHGMGQTMLSQHKFNGAVFANTRQAVIVCIRHISNCGVLVATDDSPEKMARKLSAVTAGDESPLAESGGYTVGNLKKFTAATCSTADEYCEQLIASGCTVELIVGGLSVTGNHSALEEIYGPANTAMIWGSATTGSNLFAGAKKHRHAIVLVTNPTSWNACFAATPDSAEKAIRKLTTRSSKDAVDESVDSPEIKEALRPAVELARIPGNLEYGSNQFLFGLHKAGARVKLASVPSDVTIYLFKRALAAAYGMERAPTVLLLKGTKFQLAVDGKTVWVFLTYHPPHDTYVSAAVITDDSLDKIMRKVAAAGAVQEAGLAAEIDYPPFSVSSSVTHALGDLWAVNSRVKFGVTGQLLNRTANQLGRAYGTENVMITLDAVDQITRYDPVASAFVLRATGKQVWMLFSSYISTICVSVITEDDFDKVLRKMAAASAVTESKARAILKKVSTKVGDVDPEQLKLGRKVEREHTNNPTTATKIALAHLGEDPKYYAKLDKAGLIDEARLPVPNTDGPASANELENLLSAYTPRMRADLRRVFSVAKSVRIVGHDDLSSSVVQAARAAYGRAAVVVPVIDGIVSVDASVIGSFTGKDVVVMVAINAQTGMVRVWRPLVLMVTQDSAEKIDRTITKWLSVKESLSAPDQIAESFAMAPTTWAATVRPLTAKLRAELDDIVLRADKTTYLGVVGTRLTDSLLHRADKIYGDSNVTVLSLDGWASGGFLERVEDKNIAVISNLNPLWPKMVIVITDDSPDKIARKFAVQDAQMESAQPPAGPIKDPATGRALSPRLVGRISQIISRARSFTWMAIPGSCADKMYDLMKAGYETVALLSAYTASAPNTLSKFVGKNVVCVYRSDLDFIDTDDICSVTLVATGDSPEKIDRKVGAMKSTQESAQLTESIKLTPVGAKTDRFAHDPITDTLMQLREVGAKLSFVRANGDAVHVVRGALEGIARMAGYTVGLATFMHQPSEQFILDCAGQRVVVAYRGTSFAPGLQQSSAPLYVTFIRTDDSPDKIERALNKALTVAESALVPDPATA